MLGSGRNRALTDGSAGFLLSLETHEPARLPVKVEAARQDCRARPGHVTPPGGAARLIHPPPGEWKSTSRARGAGARAEGRKSTDRGAAENKDGPTATLRPRRPAPPDRKAPLPRNLTFCSISPSFTKGAWGSSVSLFPQPPWSCTGTQGTHPTQIFG